MSEKYNRDAKIFFYGAELVFSILSIAGIGIIEIMRWMDKDNWDGMSILLPLAIWAAIKSGKNLRLNSKNKKITRHT